MKEYMMALDQGTTSSRCILFDKMGNIRAKAQKEFAQIYPQEGWVEHNPKDIWSSQYSVMTEALRMSVLPVSGSRTSVRQRSSGISRQVSPFTMPLSGSVEERQRRSTA